ncbi:MAG: response regulator [Phycisphaerae bacterium]|nr:response regulator [Phycisphaerae bacterium]
MSTGKTILLVDDDLDILEQLTAILTPQGYQIVTAGGREDAEEQLLMTRPDLAILDVMMEQSDAGFVLAHHVKRLYPDTPVILLTSVTAATSLSFQGVSPDMKSWMNADVIVNKPVRPEQIVAEVRRLLREAPVEKH